MRFCGDNLPAQFGKSKEIAERSNENDTPPAGVFERSAAILAAQSRRVAGAKLGHNAESYRLAENSRSCYFIRALSAYHLSREAERFGLPGPSHGFRVVAC
jgi:hypothetical protein